MIRQHSPKYCMQAAPKSGMSSFNTNRLSNTTVFEHSKYCTSVILYVYSFSLLHLTNTAERLLLKRNDFTEAVLSFPFINTKSRSRFTSKTGALTVIAVFSFLSCFPNGKSILPIVPWVFFIQHLQARGISYPAVSPE